MSVRLTSIARRFAVRAVTVVVMVGTMLLGSVACSTSVTAKRYSDSVLSASSASPAVAPSSAAPTSAIRGWMGVSVREREGQQGLLVVDIIPRGPAAKAGLKLGDVIVALDGQSNLRAEDFVQRIQSAAPGSDVKLRALRGNAYLQFDSVLEALPTDDELFDHRWVGRLAPSLEGLQVAEGPSPSQLLASNNRIVVLEFWSPYCAACRVLHQRLGEWQQQWSNYPVSFFGIANLTLDETHEQAKRLGLTVPQASDPEEIAFKRYGVFAVPSLFLIDERGIILAVMVGYSPQRMTRIERELAASFNRLSQ